MSPSASVREFAARLLEEAAAYCLLRQRYSQEALAEKLWELVRAQEEDRLREYWQALSLEDRRLLQGVGLVRRGFISPLEPALGSKLEALLEALEGGRVHTRYAWPGHHLEEALRLAQAAGEALASAPSLFRPLLRQVLLHMEAAAEAYREVPKDISAMVPPPLGSEGLGERRVRFEMALREAKEAYRAMRDGEGLIGALEDHLRHLGEEGKGLAQRAKGLRLVRADAYVEVGRILDRLGTREERMRKLRRAIEHILTVGDATTALGFPYPPGVFDEAGPPPPYLDGGVLETLRDHLLAEEELPTPAPEVLPVEEAEEPPLPEAPDPEALLQGFLASGEASFLAWARGAGLSPEEAHLALLDIAAWLMERAPLWEGPPLPIGLVGEWREGLVALKDIRRQGEEERGA